MKIGTILLLNVLVAGTTVGAYHLIAGPTSEPESQGYGEELVVEPEVPATTEYTPEPALQGVADSLYRDKVETLEKEVASLKQLLATLGTRGSTAATGTRSGTEGGAMPALELPVVDEGEEDPEFSEDSLRSLRAMMEKVEAQRREERLQEGLQRQLDRLGVELSDDQQKAVIGATLSYREKTRQMWRNLPRGGDDDAREKRRQAMEVMKEEYSKTVYALVPAADAEKIVQSMGRGMGFSSMRRGGDGGGGNRRGR